MKRRKSVVRFRSILCPVDFSAHAAGALRRAADLAHRSGGRLAVLFVNDPLLAAAAAAVYHRRAEMLQRTQAELERFVTRALTGGSLPQDAVVCRVAIGDPADEILRAASSHACDLIVMGTQGLDGADKWFMGSTVEHVLRRATVPVLALPKGRGRTAAPFGRVVAPVDLGRGWTRDVSAAASLARWLETELTLVHVIPPTPLVPWLRTRDAALDRRRVAAVRAVLERATAALTRNLKTTCKVAIGKPADAIAAEAATGAACLVVMALRGEHGFLGRRRGSIAYRVLTRAVAPVFALPASARAAHTGRVVVRSARRAAAGLRDAVDSRLRERDRIELAAVNALLSAGGGRTPRRRRAK